MAGDPIAGLRAEEIDRLIDSWADPSRPLSKHLDLAIVATINRQRRNLPPLTGSAPIPGCDCERCAGVPPGPRFRRPRKTSRKRALPGQRIDVEAARQVPLLEVAQRAGLVPVKPYPRAREYVACCPLHEDSRPSLRLDPEKGLWHCFPCSEGGDGIRLMQRARGISFAEAVRRITDD